MRPGILPKLMWWDSMNTGAWPWWQKKEPKISEWIEGGGNLLLRKIHIIAPCSCILRLVHRLRNSETPLVTCFLFRDYSNLYRSRVSFFTLIIYDDYPQSPNFTSATLEQSVTWFEQVRVHHRSLPDCVLRLSFFVKTISRSRAGTPAADKQQPGAQGAK